MQIRQSDLKTWNRCPLSWRYANIDGLDEDQMGSSVFGSVMHDCALYLEVHQDLEGAIARFKRFWDDPTLLDPTYTIDVYVRGTSWGKFAKDGPRILRDWWSIIQWDTDLTLAREYPFWVPIGDGHTLHGTVDKLVVRFNAKLDSYVLLVSDYKTKLAAPAYGWLADDLQFTAYCFATTCPEFWTDLPGGRGPELYAQYKDLPRYGEWVQLAGPKRLDAGERTQAHYNRLTMAVNHMARSIEADIFVPNISGDTCRYCEYRKQCGLPELMD